MFNFRVFIPCFVFSISIIPFDVTAQDELVFRDGFERCELAGKVPVDAIRWGGGGDGASWSDVLNWEGGVLPGDGDLVSIRVEGDITVIHDSSLGTTSIKTLDSCESLTVSGGTLQLNDDSRVKANLSLSGGTLTTATSLNIGGSLQHSGGILTGSGTVTVAGVITWTGGNQSGPGETIANGGVTMTNSNDKVLVSRTLTLNGDTVWAGDVRMRDAATINSHAAFDIQTDHPIRDIGGALSSFNNYGTLTKSAGTGSTEIQSHVFNHGTITVNTGTLSLGKTGTLASSEGTFEAAPAATLELRGDHTMLAASSFSGAGSVSVMGSGSNVLIQGDFLLSGLVDVGNGTLTFDTGPLTLGAVALSGGVLTSTSTLDVTGSFQLSAGALTGVHTVTVAGLLTWTGGNQSGLGETVANGNVIMTHGNDKVLISRTLTLNGDSVWSGDVRMADAATINSNAAFDIQADFPLSDSGGALSTFNNNGTLTKSSGAGNSEFRVDFVNTGNVSVTTGSVSFDRAFTQESGATLTVGIKSSVAFDNYNVSQSATLAGALDISLLNSFEPLLDEMYVIMNFASRSGVFAEVNGLIIGNGKKFEVIYAATNVTLKVVTDT